MINQIFHSTTGEFGHPTTRHFHSFLEYKDCIFACWTEAQSLLSATAHHSLQSRHCARDRQTNLGHTPDIHVTQFLAQRSKVDSFTPCLHHKRWDQNPHHSTWGITFKPKYGPELELCRTTCLYQKMQTAS